MNIVWAIDPLFFCGKECHCWSAVEHSEDLSSHNATTWLHWELEHLNLCPNSHHHPIPTTMSTLSAQEKAHNLSSRFLEDVRSNMELVLRFFNRHQAELSNPNEATWSAFKTDAFEKAVRNPLSINWMTTESHEDMTCNNAQREGAVQWGCPVAPTHKIFSLCTNDPSHGEIGQLVPNLWHSAHHYPYLLDGRLQWPLSPHTSNYIVKSLCIMRGTGQFFSPSPSKYPIFIAPDANTPQSNTCTPATSGQPWGRSKQ